MRSGETIKLQRDNFTAQQTRTEKVNTPWKTSKVPLSTKQTSLLCKSLLHLTVQLARPKLPKQNKFVLTNCIITCLYSARTPAVPPGGSSPAPPAGRWKRCPAALSGSLCGSRLQSAPPARPRSLTRKKEGKLSLCWRLGVGKKGKKNNASQYTYIRFLISQEGVMMWKVNKQKPFYGDFNIYGHFVVLFIILL